MHGPHEIVGAEIWDGMQKTFREWVQQDSFAPHAPVRDGPAQQAGSVRELIGSMFLFDAHIGLWDGNERARCSLEMSVDELLAREVVTTDNGRRRIEAIFMKWLCLSNLSSLMSEGTSWRSSFRRTPEEHWAAMASSAGCKTMEQVRQRVDQIENGLALSEALMKVLRKEIGAKSLWSFFQTTPDRNGYLSWSDRSYTDVGEPMKASTVATTRGVVAMRVARYEDTSDAGIRAYEWSAELRQDPAEALPSAIACGMVYVLPREDGFLMSTSSDLRWAADAVADADVAQVMGFLEQHYDAADRMEAGDLCFLWLWERRSGSEKGVGAEVLRAALTDLKRRFRRLKTLVANLEPAQFAASSLPQDPPRVQEAKIDASEKLEAHIRGLEPHAQFKGELRLIVSQKRSFDETLASLGMADIAEGLRGL